MHSAEGVLLFALPYREPKEDGGRNATDCQQLSAQQRRWCGSGARFLPSPSLCGDSGTVKLGYQNSPGSRHCKPPNEWQIVTSAHSLLPVIGTGRPHLKLPRRLTPIFTLNAVRRRRLGAKSGDAERIYESASPKCAPPLKLGRLGVTP